MAERIEAFAEMLKESKKTVFFGGAGVSTESGVKDYRSEDGLYNTVREYGVSPEEILSHSFFKKHPDIFYDFYYKYFLKDTAKPNRAHIALSKLEEKNMLSSVITQNIDALHQAAGSKNVIELHGTTYYHYCPVCMKPFPNEEIKALGVKVPHCPHCNNIIRPKVTLYEEALDESAVSKAVSEISEADLLIIGGTSLAVYPAAMYIRYFKGKHIVLINRDPTQYDAMANIIFRESIGEVLEKATEMAIG